MNTTEWLAATEASADDLRELLRIYHPINRASQYKGAPMSITAHGAEAACASVRADIVENSEGDPEMDFNDALADGNVGRLVKLLNEAWFGVPESTACWRIVGFKQAVDLLEDLPED